MLAQEAAILALPESYANPEEVYTLLARLRREMPVVRIAPEGVRPLWLVTRAEELRFIETHPEDFLTGPRPSILPIAQEKINIELFGTENSPLESLINTDGKRHHQLRQLTQSWFMPAELRKKRAEIDTIAKQFVQRMAEMQPECDFANDIAFWYPLRVLNTILGLPEEMDKPFLELTQKLMSTTDEEFHDSSLDAGERLARTISQFSEIFSPIIADRRQHPRDDLASVLANSTIDGQPLSEMETLGYFIVVATAGHDTTSATTAGGLLALIQHPEQMARLKDNPDLLPTAVEEFIRWVAPVKHFVRTAVRDIEVGGQMIKKGENLALLFSSTCRDEAVFEDPHEFRIDRTPNNHLAFGTGPHLCLGMHLARLEVTAFFKELLPRLKQIELTGDQSYAKAVVVSGLKTMPIKFKMG